MEAILCIEAPLLVHSRDPEHQIFQPRLQHAPEFAILVLIAVSVVHAVRR